MRRCTALLAIVTCVAGPACVARPAMTLHQAGTSCRSDGRSPMRWIRPASPRDHERLDAWCARVGPVFRQEPARHAGAVTADGLTIVSWNTHGGSADARRLVALLRAGELTGGRPVGHFVLLLQEARRVIDRGTRSTSDPRAIDGSLDDRREIVRLSTDLGTAAVYAPTIRHGNGVQDRGNAILSTLPLSDVDIVELPFERQRRLAVVATVVGTTRRGERLRLRVASAHFDTGLMLTRGGSDAARARQAQALADVLSSSRGPVVVGGDFNTEWSADEPAVAILTRAFPDARQPAMDTWRGPLGLRRQLDYVFARIAGGSLGVTRVSDRMGSDHHPLLATVPTAVLTDEVWTSAAAASIPFAVDFRGRTQPQGGADWEEQ